MNEVNGNISRPLLRTRRRGDRDILLLVLSCPLSAHSIWINGTGGLLTNQITRFSSRAEALQNHIFYYSTCIGCDYPAFSSSILTKSLNSLGTIL